MDQDEILERIRKRREELEQQEAEKQVVTFETDEATGETTPTINFDNMSWQDQTALIIKAKANGYTNDSYRLATEQADRAEQSLLDGASRETLTDFYQVYTDESNRAVQNDDLVSYYKNEILKSRIKNKLADTATPFTALQDVGAEIGTNVMGNIADTINVGAMAYINATDNLDANILYDIAKRDSGTLQNTLDNYGWGKDNYERLEKLRQQYPTGEAHDIIETLYNTVTKQSFNGDKSYFDTTVQYLNNLTNKDRFQKFERAHTLDETEARENLKLRESMSYNDLGKFALDTVGTLSYMAPSIALGMSTAGALGGGVTTAAGKQVLSEQAGKEIAKQVGLTTMGLSAGGQAANTALRQGYEWNQAMNKGLADGLLEYVSEVVGGEALNKLLVGTRTAVTPLGQLIGKGVEKIKNKWVRLGVGILGDISAEAWEEMATEAISPLLDEAILGKKITDWEKYGQDIFNAGVQSILPTLILGGMNRIQVANIIKSEMESITAAVELNEYISQEQKDKLLEGIVEAYDNASHFLSDEKSEEQYNQVVKDTFDALKEAEKKYKSAQELSRLITAGANVELQQRAPEANIIPRLEQTRQASETVNRLNEAQQGIQNVVDEQNVRTALGQELGQSTASQQPQEQQSTEEIEEEKTVPEEPQKRKPLRKNETNKDIKKKATKSNNKKSSKGSQDIQADTITEDQTFSTDIETSKNSIVERKIREVEADPKLREEHEVTSLTEIRNLTRELLKGRLGVGQFRHKAYGVYNTRSNWVRLREISNADTLMHETGHFIDDEILPKMYNNNPAMKQELEKLCEAAFGKHYNKNKKAKLSEGFAEATRYFMVDPQGLVKIAPVTAAMIEQEFSGSEVLKKFYPKIQKMFHDYINMTAQERLHSKVVTGTPSSKVTIDSKPRRTFRAFLKQMFNKYEGATMFDARNEKLYKEKFKGKSLPTTLKLFDNLRRSNSSGESIKQQLANGVYDPSDGKRITKGLSRILKPLKEEAKKNHKQAGVSYDKYLNNRLNDMIDLGLAERTIELSERSKKEDKVYETGIRLNDAEAIVEQFKDDKILHDVLKEIRKVGTDLIDYAVKKGVLKPKAAEEIKKLNMFYMPLNRILDDYGSFGSSTQKGATGTAFKRLKGSDRDIQNPLESLVGNWARVLKTIDDNFIRQRLVEVAHTVGDYGDYFTEVAPLSRYQGQVPLKAFEETLGLILSPTEYAKLFPFLDETYNLFVPETADPTKLTLSYLDNGVRKYLKFANNDYGRPLYDILTSLNANQANQLLNTISRFNQGIRLGATALNPFFAIGNTLSDQFQAFLYSDGLIIPVVNSIFDMVRLGKARALQKVDKASHSDKRLAQLYREYKESGASLSGKYKLAEEEVMKTLPDIWGVSNKALFGSDSKLNKAKDIVHKFGNLLAYFPEFSEEMTRFGEFVRVYDKLVKDGMKPSQAKLEAGIKAKEITQDFSIQGETMQYVNKIIPFSAAKVGGLYRFGQELKNHPGRLSFRMGTLIALAMMVAQLRHGDDDAEAYYEELNNRKKFDNFVLPWGGSEPVILKKPQGAPRYFINLVEAIYDLATGYVPKGEEKKRLQDWLELAVSDILPVNSPTDMIPGFAQPLLENVINQDLYYGSKIVPQNLEKLDPKNQYNEYTSRIGRALGSIINYSPMKIDNFIEGAFAGMGSAALSLGDWIYDLITGESSTPEARLSATYIGSRFKADVYRSSESVNIVYDKIEEYEREEAEGRITPEQKEELENLKTAKAIFTKISKEMKQTRADSSLDSKEKGDKINELYELRTDAARYYLGKKLLNEDNADKIDLYKYYPASSTYKYKVGGKTIELSFEDDKIQEEYATMLRTQYEKELERLKKKNEYKRASDEDKLTKEKNLLTRVRNEVNDTMKTKVYREQRGE